MLKGSQVRSGDLSARGRLTSCLFSLIIVPMSCPQIQQALDPRLQVWASKWNDRAWLSRRARGVAEGDLFMSCLLQQVSPCAPSIFCVGTLNLASGHKVSSSSSSMPLLPSRHDFQASCPLRQAHGMMRFSCRRAPEQACPAPRPTDWPTAVSRQAWFSLHLVLAECYFVRHNQTPVSAELAMASLRCDAHVIAVGSAGRVRLCGAHSQSHHQGAG